MQAATPQAHEMLVQAEREQALVLTRNIELGDLMLGYEQARQLLLKDAQGRSLLALAEQPGSFLSGVLLRQIFDSSRAFVIDVFDVPHLLEHGAAPERGARLHHSVPLEACMHDSNAVLCPLLRIRQFLLEMCSLFSTVRVLRAHHVYDTHRGNVTLPHAPSEQ